MRYKISNQEMYQKVKKALERGAAELEGNWFNPEYKEKVNKYMLLANAVYDYEVEVGLFGKYFEQWKLKQNQERKLRNLS